MNKRIVFIVFITLAIVCLVLFNTRAVGIIESDNGKFENSLPERVILTFEGVLVLGKELHGRQSVCPEGIYLVADEGKYFYGKTSFLFLGTKNKTQQGNYQIYSNKKHLNSRVLVAGEHVSQDVCKAYSCQCQEYFFVDKIKKI